MRNRDYICIICGDINNIYLKYKDSDIVIKNMLKGSYYHHNKHDKKLMRMRICKGKYIKMTNPEFEKLLYG